jgi:hypothetical protein
VLRDRSLDQDLPGQVRQHKDRLQQTVEVARVPNVFKADRALITRVLATLRHLKRLILKAGLNSSLHLLLLRKLRSCERCCVLNLVGEVRCGGVSCGLWPYGRFPNLLVLACEQFVDAAFLVVVLCLESAPDLLARVT